jgi:hypothetical protein
LLELKDSSASMSLRRSASIARPRRYRTSSTRCSSLGYSDKEAVATQSKLPEGLPVGDGIRQALKLLAKARIAR